MTVDAVAQQRYLQDVAPGMALPEVVKKPTPTMLFRFSAVTWNAHRIHYDQPYAATEAHPGVLVQATMHGAFLLQMLTAFAGREGRILQFSYSNRGRAVPGDTLTCGGTVTSVDPEGGRVYCDVTETNQNQLVCVRGQAVLALPSRS
jgi:hydroxyacyl-ACP dehydratase HTD2-like protein with hotdog domain